MKLTFFVKVCLKSIQKRLEQQKLGAQKKVFGAEQSRFHNVCFQAKNTISVATKVHFPEEVYLSAKKHQLHSRI